MAVGNYYKKQAFIVETMRATIEEELGVPTRRTKLKLLSPWPPGEYSHECHPNPYSAEAIRLNGEAAVTGLPLEACFNKDDTGIILKEDPRLPYACPGRIMRGPSGPTGRGVVYTTSTGAACSEHVLFDPTIYNAYIVEAVLEGPSPVEFIVEWCPLGLVDQGDLFDRVKYAVDLASALTASGAGVKINVVPGYAVGSRHMDGLYWSSGAYYLSEAEVASNVSSAINAHIYIVGKGYINGKEVLDIPFLYGGWIHTYRSGVPPIAVSGGSGLEGLSGLDLWEQVFQSVESFLDRASGMDLPLEARGLLFHLDRIVSSRCTRGLRLLLPHILRPIHGQGISGLRLLPWLTFYDSPGAEVYDLEYGRPLYTGSGRLRYETLVYYVNLLKRVMVEADRFCRGN